MMQNKILVIDSGIGGLNILKKLMEDRPNNSYIYYGDTIHMPYGNKSYSELLMYSTNIINSFLNEGISTVVVACGTLCSTVYPSLIERFPNLKFINIVDATCEYINNSNYNKIGVIATVNTINSHSFKKRLNKELIEKETPELVPILESREVDKYDYYIDYYLKDMRNIDALILGCTHYILLKDRIEKYLGKPVINMADYIIKDIPNSGNKNVTLYFSKIDNNLINNVKDIIENIELIKKEV